MRRGRRPGGQSRIVFFYTHTPEEILLYKDEAEATFKDQLYIHKLWINERKKVAAGRYKSEFILLTYQERAADVIDRIIYKRSTRVGNIEKFLLFSHTKSAEKYLLSMSVTQFWWDGLFRPQCITQGLSLRTAWTGVRTFTTSTTAPTTKSPSRGCSPISLRLSVSKFSGLLFLNSPQLTVIRLNMTLQRSIICDQFIDSSDIIFAYFIIDQFYLVLDIYLIFKKSVVLYLLINFLKSTDKEVPEVQFKI